MYNLAIITIFSLLHMGGGGAPRTVWNLKYFTGPDKRRGMCAENKVGVFNSKMN